MFKKSRQTKRDEVTEKDAKEVDTLTDSGVRPFVVVIVVGIRVSLQILQVRIPLQIRRQTFDGVPDGRWRRRTKRVRPAKGEINADRRGGRRGRGIDEMLFRQEAAPDGDAVSKGGEAPIVGIRYGKKV